MRRGVKAVGSVIKWVVRIIGLLVFIFILLGVISYFLRPGEAPDVGKASWAVQTYSNDAMKIPGRIYLAEEVEYLDDGTPVIRGYWSFDGENWKKQRGEKQFPVEEYGIVDIKRRVE